jgi:8-oxo-dGTP diphosphatase
MTEESWLDRITTPRIGVVAVVESPDRKRILVIRRRFPPLGLAFPGGFMEMGETIARTAIREVMEETGIDALDVGLLGATSCPSLDPRAQFVVIAVVLRAKGEAAPKAGDDASEAFWADWRCMKASTTWDELTDRSRIEFKEYSRWRCFNDYARDVSDEWDLPALR